MEKCLKIVKYVCISQNSNNLESNEEAFSEEAFELHLLFELQIKYFVTRYINMNVCDYVPNLG